MHIEPVYFFNSAASSALGDAISTCSRARTLSFLSLLLGNPRPQIERLQPHPSSLTPFPKFSPTIHPPNETDPSFSGVLSYALAALVKNNDQGHM